MSISIDTHERATNVSIRTASGDQLNVFYDAETKLLVVDLYDRCERGGYELVRQTINEGELLAPLDGMPELDPEDETQELPDPVERVDTDAIGAWRFSWDTGKVPIGDDKQ